MHIEQRAMNSLDSGIFLDEFERFWRPFVRVFQFFCVSNYSIFRSPPSNRFFTSYLSILYFISFSSLHILPVLFNVRKGLQRNENHGLKYKENTLVYYVNFLSVISTVVTHITVHLEPLFTSVEESELFERFRAIHIMFVSKLNFVTNFRIRRAKYI